MGKDQGENQGSELEKLLALQLRQLRPEGPRLIHGHTVRDITGTCFLHTWEARSPFERCCFRGRGGCLARAARAPEEV